ncbi:MAG: hypothetical protein IKW78_07660 [Prevotella sp.]|nr:hypothetical protein [Prevotella sp.]
MLASGVGGGQNGRERPICRERERGCLSQANDARKARVLAVVVWATMARMASGAADSTAAATQEMAAAFWLLL